MGDGTYYHSGTLSVRAAVSANVNITFKILYNDATAATGGQRLPLRMTVPAVTRQLEAEGVKATVVVTDQPDKYGSDDRFAPNVTIRHRDELDHVQRELRTLKGVTAIVYDQTCAAEKRRRRKRGKFPDPPVRSFINPLVCEGCGDCNVKSNCVSVLPLETDFGRKRVIDQSSCNKDFACIRGFCPSYVLVEGGSLKQGKGPIVDQALLRNLPAPRQPTLDKPYGIVIAGVGGTGIITIGALLGMASHIEGKGVSVLDMTGVAQKGGAITTHVRIARDPDEIRSIRIAAGDADAVIGCDMIVTCENDVMVRMQRGTTRAAVNTNRLPTVAFIRNPDQQAPWSAMKDGLRDALGEQAINFVDASDITSRLLGNALMSNVFMLGYAFQKGLIPLNKGSILRAIELNSVSVEANRLAFQWGRLAAHDPGAVDAILRKEAPLGIGPASTPTLDGMIERRAGFLTEYQNAAYAQRYRTLVDLVRQKERSLGHGESLSKTVAFNYFKLLAYKDEYEVARLYTSGEFDRQLAATFEGDYRIRYHFAPPAISRVDPKIGEPRKMSFGAWIRPVLSVLAKLRFMRGGPFDVFGWTAERRRDRQSIADYESTLHMILSRLDDDNADIARQIAALPETIRGFGHIRDGNRAAAEAKKAELVAQFQAGVEKRAKVA